MTTHKHAALMQQYAKDWAETDEPWKRWEVTSHRNGWGALCGHPYWNEKHEYRRKPRTLTYTVTIPEPLREAPKHGEKYYFADPSAANLYGWASWDAYRVDKRLHGRGLCFATKEDAITAAKAMMPFKQEEA